MVKHQLIVRCNQCKVKLFEGSVNTFSQISKIRLFYSADPTAQKIGPNLPKRDTRFPGIRANAHLDSIKEKKFNRRKKWPKDFFFLFLFRCRKKISLNIEIVSTDSATEEKKDGKVGFRENLLNLPEVAGKA